MNLNNHFFSNIFQNEKTIQKIRQECINIDIDDILKIKFVDKIDSIFQKYPLILEDKSTFIKQITFNFWNIISCYMFQKNDKNPKSLETLIDYLNASIRIIEFAIFVHSKELQDIKKIYFDIKVINICFYKHFIQINNKILINNKNLILVLKDTKNKGKLTVFIADDNSCKYLPSSIPKNEIESEKKYEETFWFERYFRLNNKQILDVYEKISSHGGGGGNKGIRESSKHKDFDEYNYIDENIFTDDDLSKLTKIEDKLEAFNSASKMQSIMFKEPKQQKDRDQNYSDKKDFNKKKFYDPVKNILGIRRFEDKHLNSKYKEYLVNKTISYYYAKNSMYLYSKAPQLDTFKNLVNELLINKNDYRYSLILCSLFSGINIKEVIRIFFEESKNFDLKKNSYILEIKHDKNIFANKVPKTDVLISPNGNKSIVHFPSFIKDFINVIKSEYERAKKNKENFEDFVDNEYFKCKEVLKKEIKTLNKTLSYVNLKKIHKLFYHYFSIFHKNTDTSILFLVSLSKYNQVRATYASQPKQLIYYELWIKEFYQILTQNESNIQSFIDIDLSEEVGSPKVVKASVFKNFLLNLSYLKPKNKIEEFNLKMIFIRYSLSILLATRDDNESCNLSEFSKRFGILTIHEKAKHIKSSKRIIPLTAKALFYIDEFYELIKSFEIDYTYPILLNEENCEIIINSLSKESVLKFIQTFKDYISFEEIENFVKVVDLNFGRHIFATESLRQGFNKDYENEFMGHFSMGSLGLGMYSNFDLNDYIESSKKFIESIENKYLPQNITHKDIKCYKN